MTKINKKIFSLFAILIISLLTSSIALHQVNAQTTSRTASYIYVGASTGLIGVGQELSLVYWTADPPPDIGEETGAIPSPTGRAGWDGVKLIITDPNGNNETITMPRSDPVGGGYQLYTPQTVGTYSFYAVFPETWKNSTNTRILYYASESTPDTFEVQTDPVGTWRETPLPDSYWERPINSFNRDWYVLAGNWLGGPAVSPPGSAGGTTTRLGYGQGPESAHIVWTKPFYAGGTMDERYGNIGFQTYHYQGLIFRNPIIIDGIIYYAARVNAHIEEGYYAVDLYTGQTLNYYNSTPPAFGAIYNYDSPNQHGGFSYLWRTSGVTLPPNSTSRSGTQTWEMIDAFTGNSITKIANVSASGTAVYGKDGSILRYNIANLGTSSNPDYYLQVWNSSATPTLLLGTTGTNYWQWRPAGRAVHNGDNGFSLNVSIPQEYVNGPRNSIVNQTGIIRTVREGDQIIIGTAGQNNEDGTTPARLVSLSLEKGQEGKKLWDLTFTPPSSAGNKTIDFQAVDPEDGIILFGCAKTRQSYVYSLSTGKELWVSEPEPAYNYYYWTSYDSHRQIYDGKLISAGYSGVLTAYNITTGKILWNYTAENSGLESFYGNIPTVISAIVDGKIYVGSSEHSPQQPMWRNPDTLACIDAETGEKLWGYPIFGVSGTSGTDAGGASYVIGDGYLIALNAYDGQLYAFGKGATQTTVSASPKTSLQGETILIEGSVTDISPGTTDYAIAARFPNGVPAASDETMNEWMMHVYSQQPAPTNAAGVSVKLYVTDANGNYRPIGQTTSDGTGLYSYQWEPDIAGKYTITAMFEGSNSYWKSSATSAFTVSDPKTQENPPSQTQSIADLYFVPAIAGIILAIAIVGIGLALLLLKKRP
ncbi:MAG: PQQ-like beta-propeller repeat protein [Candidatus Bathyarchaeota archaeon]|nr:PQQ-like beta-propeller repeat protein [Candidatus Termitimicrobium sp.]